MPGALTVGRIDAAWVTEPFLKTAKQQGNKVVTLLEGHDRTAVLDFRMVFDSSVGHSAPRSGSSIPLRHSRHGRVGKRQSG
jgi:hypothetical protein